MSILVQEPMVSILVQEPMVSILVQEPMVSILVHEPMVSILVQEPMAIFFNGCSFRCHEEVSARASKTTEYRAEESPVRRIKL